MISSKDLSNLRLEGKVCRCRHTRGFLIFSPTVIRSPLFSQKKPGRRWFMGVAFPLVQSLYGKVLHECIQGIFSLPFPGALFRLALLLAFLSSRISVFLALLFFLSTSSTFSLFLPCSCVSRNTSALPSIPSLLQIHSPQLGSVSYRSRLIAR